MGTFLLVAMAAAAVALVHDSGSPARADVDVVFGSAYGAAVTLGGLPALPETPSVAGVADEATDSFGPISDVASPPSVPDVLSIATLTAETFGAGVAGENHFAFATSGVEANDVVLFDFNVTAAAVLTTCFVDGDGVDGTTELIGGQALLGLPLPTNPPPNTSFSVGNLDVVLNEQFVTTVLGSARIDVNAIHVRGLTPANVMADVIVGHVSCQANGPDVLAPPVVQPAIVTQATASANLGQPISDVATLSGGVNPTGTITFNAYGPADPTCAGPPIFSSTVPVSGNGDYASAPFVPIDPGTYQWVATYSGDVSNTPVASACGDPGATSTVIALPAIDVLVTVDFASLAEPGGEVEFTVEVLNTGLVPVTISTLLDDVYGDLTARSDSTCSTGPNTVLAPAATFSCVFVADVTGTAGFSQSNTVTVTAVDTLANVASGSDTVTVNILAPAAISTSVATQATPTAFVGEPITDTATVTASSASLFLNLSALVAILPGVVATGPTGTVDFMLFDNPTCAGPPVFTSVGRPLGGGPPPTATSEAFVPTAPGSYYWIAAYSGDAAHQPAAGVCGESGETTVVNQVLPPLPPPPVIVHQATPTATVGQTISDVATLSGGQGPTGSITFNLYPPADPTCAGAPVFTAATPVGGGGNYDSGAFVATAVGTYHWVAGYSGDAGHPPVTTACGDTGGATVVRNRATVLVDDLATFNSSSAVVGPAQGPGPTLFVSPSSDPAAPAQTATGGTITTTATSSAQGRAVAPQVSPGTTAPATTIAAPTTTIAAPTTTFVAPTTTAVRPQLPDDEGLPVAQVAAGVGALIVVGGALLLLLLLRRRQARRAVAVPVVGKRRRGPRTHSEVADDIIGEAPGPDLSQAGPASARMAEACGGSAVATPLLATLAWEAFVTDDRFGQALATLGASDRALREGQVVVVRHAGGTRHDLLVFDPAYNREPRRMPVDLFPSAQTVESRRQRLSWPDLLTADAPRPWPSLDERTVLHAIQEAAEATEFTLVVARLPKVLVTRCPTPAWPVSVTSAGEATATAGAVVQAADGSLAVTTVLHAVKGHESVWVGGREVRVISTHEPTDSCLLTLPDLDFDEQGKGLAGPLQGVSPRQYDRTTFEGITSGIKSTTVTSWDMSILARQQFLGSKVYTTPDTVPGDSGAALIDSSDQILGFAVYRSAFGEPIEYSAWAWADQVFGAHDARPVQIEDSTT